MPPFSVGWVGYSIQFPELIYPELINYQIIFSELSLMKEVCLSFQIGGHPRITPWIRTRKHFRFKLISSYQLRKRETP